MRYYFHLFNDTTTLDEEGQELPSDAAAIELAADNARTMAGESVTSEGHLILNHRIEVQNDNGDEIGTVYFRDVVQVKDRA